MLEPKEEHMVKLPINLTNEVQREATLRDAVRKRNELEDMAWREREETGGYIRPVKARPAAAGEGAPGRGTRGSCLREFLTKDLSLSEAQLKVRTASKTSLARRTS